MKNIHNIVIVGGVDDNPSQFVTQIEPLKLDTDCEVSLTSLYHGEVYNIHDKNNKVYFFRGNRMQLEVVKHLRGKPTIVPVSDLTRNQLSLHSIRIPEGNYASVASVCWYISNMIKEKLKLTKKGDGMNPIADKKNNVINVDLSELYLVVEGKSDTPWFMLGVLEDKYEKFSIQDKDLQCTEFPAILRSNIVENSYINGKLFHNLGIVPIKNRSGWSLYNPTNPHFVPITVREFSKIRIELRDIYGNYIQFNPSYKTIITLCIRSIKGRHI